MAPIRWTGGVVWHTQGSGKSLTMVMLAESLALAPDIVEPRIVLVTDRVDLDEQIWGMFRSCGREAVMARSGAHLLELLERGKASIITTLIHKFDAALGRRDSLKKSDNIFVLVDEAHRSQSGRLGGFSEFAGKMRRVMPDACYIGFTGTPLMKQDRDTAQQFGGLIQYAVALIYSHEAGRREAAITFDVGQGTQDLGFRAELPIRRVAVPAAGAAEIAPAGAKSRLRCGAKAERGAATVRGCDTSFCWSHLRAPGLMRATP